MKAVATLVTEGGDFYLFIFLNGSIEAECLAQPNMSLPVKPICVLCQFVQKINNSAFGSFTHYPPAPFLTRCLGGLFFIVYVYDLLPKELNLSSDMGKGVGVLMYIQGINFLLPE